MIKRFSDFLNETTLKNNPAIPSDYMDEYTEFMTQKYEGEHPREFMSNINKMIQLQHGHEKELEEIAKKIVKNFYGTILDDVNFDVKIVEPGDQEQIEMSQKISFEKEPNFEIKKSGDESTKLEIDKRKIVNNIIQGESFNTFKLFQLMKDDVDEVNPELSKLYNKVVDDSYTLYWRLPEESQVRMVKDLPQFGNYFEVKYNDDNVTIKVRALDMAALVHEMVKGVYELIAHRGIPEDKEMAEVVLKHTDTYWDEIEDLRYGPKISSDIRDFINKNPKINTYPNLREFVFGYMVDSQILPTEEFLNLINGILNNTREARTTIDEFVENAINEIRSYEEEPEQESEPTEEELPDIDFQELVNAPKPVPNKPVPDSPMVVSKSPEDYSKLTEPEFKTKYGELERELNKAFDSDDMNKAKEIGKEINRLKSIFQSKYNKEFVPRKV